MATNQLYDLADELYRQAPWEWMYEYEIIGLRHPVTGELAHISIMGSNGGHLCLALYLGEESLHRLNLIHGEASERDDLLPEDVMSLILESRQLQVVFEYRNQLSKSDLAEIKKLGRKYKGGNFPQFRSFQPGRCPARINDEEEDWLVHALTQIMEIIPDLESGQIVYKLDGEEGSESLVRECHEGVWRNTWLPTDTRLFQFPTPEPDAALVKKVTGYPSRAEVQCQFQIIPSPVGASSENAIFPYATLSVNADSGFVFGMELLSVEKQSFQKLIASVPDHFLHQWDRHQVCPASLHVATLGSYALLEKTAAALGVSLVLENELPALNDALASALSFLHGGEF